MIGNGTLRRALQVLADHPGVRPREFARFMWPDSPGWRRLTKCGEGVHRGGGMHLAGGGLLGRLRRDGVACQWIDPGTYALTDKGKEKLAELGNGREERRDHEQKMRVDAARDREAGP